MNLNFIVQSTPVTQTSDNWNFLLDKLGEDIRERGHLIIIPTETVYGLAANALNFAAVSNIFEAKCRPLNDPVICHVAKFEDAIKLYDLTDCESKIIELLARQFWPGPLTIVAKANKVVPEIVTASTGFVAVRWPNHPIAQDIIKAAKVPLAAPSANKFGCISPSQVSHVLENLDINLKNSPQLSVYILDGGNCSIGIESSVCKIQELSPKCVSIEILRKGFVTLSGIEKMLDSHLQKHEFTVCYGSQYLSNCNDKLSSPGLSITHYAPKIPAVLVIQHTYLKEKTAIKLPNSKHVPLTDCIFLDVVGKFSEMKFITKYYFSINHFNESAYHQNNLKYVHQNLFDSLHIAEKKAIQLEASFIIIGIYDLTNSNVPELAYSIYDRFFRAASGRIGEFI